MTPLTCIHCTIGLCPKCQAEYDYDPQSWLEMGDHDKGLCNRLDLEIMIEMRQQPQPVFTDDIPL